MSALTWDALNARMKTVSAALDAAIAAQFRLPVGTEERLMWAYIVDVCWAESRRLDRIWYRLYPESAV